jgi:hypothetical protein
VDRRKESQVIQYCGPELMGKAPQLIFNLVEKLTDLTEPLLSLGWQLGGQLRYRIMNDGQELTRLIVQRMSYPPGLLLPSFIQPPQRLARPPAVGDIAGNPLDAHQLPISIDGSTAKLQRNPVPVLGDDLYLIGGATSPGEFAL